MLSPTVISRAPKTCISTLGWHSPAGVTSSVLRAGGNTAGAWPSDGRAIYVPVLLETASLVRFMAIVNTVQDTGCLVDVGVYNEQKTLLVSAAGAGSAIAQGPAGIQVFDVTDTTIGPGLVYLAMYCDKDASSTETFLRSALTNVILQACGVSQEAVGGGAKLPATATFAGGAPSNSYLPLIIAARRSVF